jgi:3-isopropylmalate dehydratase small subunit
VGVTEILYGAAALQGETGSEYRHRYFERGQCFAAVGHKHFKSFTINDLDQYRMFIICFSEFGCSSSREAASML